MMYFDPIYMLFAIPGMILAGAASWYTKHMFNKYAQVRAATGMSGAQAARHMLDVNGLQSVGVERVSGFLSDHYDPRHRVLRLSPPVYDTPSLAAIGVACHEAGHALQHAKNYVPLKLRSAMVPATNWGSRLSYIVLMAGAMLQAKPLINLALLLFSLTVLFAMVTLPVEWDASVRAKKAMVANGIVTTSEQAHAGQVLNAAFLTYVASAVSSLLVFLYYVMRFSGRR